MVVVTIEQAQAELVKLLNDVAEGEEVVIYRGDIPVGRLLPAEKDKEQKPLRQFGQFAGRIKIAEDFDAPLDGFSEYSLG